MLTLSWSGARAVSKSSGAVGAELPAGRIMAAGATITDGTHACQLRWPLPPTPWCDFDTALSLPEILVVYSADRGMIITGYQLSSLSQTGIPAEARWLR